jgi:hypothetical protein
MSEQETTPHDRHRTLMHRFGRPLTIATTMKRCPTKVAPGEVGRRLQSELTHECLDQVEADLKAGGLRDE